MPDFERVLDELSVDLAKTESEKQYAIGFIEGKKKARIEVLLIVITLYFSIVLIGKYFGT